MTEEKYTGTSRVETTEGKIIFDVKDLQPGDLIQMSKTEDEDDWGACLPRSRDAYACGGAELRKGEKGMKQVNIRKDRYVVQNNDGEDAWLSLMTADEIIESVSMSDCSGISIEAWEQTEIGKLSKLTIKGTWHADDPLLIEAFREDGTVAFAGRGVDH